ncbi:MAG: NAD(P)-binding protein [Candidatus Nealsonbacteria bacterium]|nr:NAD(P)-binding protein [Candidatus Nealsonbacteria bacterium]
MEKNQFASKKVAIIGGGISGLYLAWKLADAGHRVKVFEKKKTLGKKECSGLVSERVFNFIPQARKLIKTQIDFVLVHAPRKTLKINYKEKFYILDHEDLDREVALLAKAAGVEIVLGQDINELPAPADFDRVIGCDGYNSIVRRKLGLPSPTFRLGIQGFCAPPRGAQPVHPAGVHTWVVPNGFIWEIPRVDRIEYGIMADPADARRIFEEFCRRKNLTIEDVRSSIVPQGFTIPKNSAITLCGDAVGLTKPWSGGGIAWGLMAADMLLSTFPDFLAYRKKARKFFLPKIIFSKASTRFGYFMALKLPWLLPARFTIRGDFLL